MSGIKRFVACISIVLAILAILALFATTQLWQAPPQKGGLLDSLASIGIEGNITVMVKCDLPTVPEIIPRLGLVERSISKELLMRMAREVFGFGPDVTVIPFSPSDVSWITDGAQNLRVIGLTTLIYDGHFLRRQIKISPEEAKSIADEFLERLRQFYPQPPNLAVRFKEVGEGVVEAGSGWSAVYAWAVNYEQEVHGIPLEFGAELDFWVADNGVVQLEMYQPWTELDGSFRIMRPEEALKKFHRGEIYWPFGMLGLAPVADGKLAVEEVFLAYFMDNSMFATQTHLDPVYVFKCRLSYSVYDMEINDTLKLCVQASA